jgi:hypothetical protein
MPPWISSLRVSDGRLADDAESSVSVDTPMEPESDSAPVQSTSPRDTPLPIEGKMLSILRARPEANETVVLAFRRKEAELIALCATLSLVESMQLARRLERANTGDELATAFSRLVVERRQRVIGFLNNARRRTALAGRK